MKKFFALVLAIMMVMSLALPAAADGEDTYTITITNTDPASGANHKYEAYQIFAGKLDSSGAILSDITWGESINSDNFLAALKADTTDFMVDSVDADGNPIKVNAFASAVTAKDVSETLAKPAHHTEAFVNAFAKYATANLVTQEVDGKVVPKPVADSGAQVAAPYTIKIPAAKTGYYLVRDILVDPDEKNPNDMFDKDISDYILQVVGNVTVEHKGSIPTMDKQVSETGSTYHDSIATGIGETHYYRIVAELPDDYRLYDTYYLEFKDIMSEGLTFDEIHEVKALIRSSGKAISIKLDKDSADENHVGYTWTATRNDDGTTTLEIILQNTKTIEANDENISKAALILTADDAIEVVYKAHVNENAVVDGNGIPNKASIIYSNDPNSDGKGESTPDQTHVYPINLKLIKNDGKETTKMLPGAEFILARLHSEGTSSHYEYAVVNEDTGKISHWVHHYNGDGCENDQTKKDEHNEAVAADKEATDIKDKQLGSVLITNQEGEINVGGLDTGRYDLIEIKAPDGYNKLAENIILTVSLTVNEANDVIQNMTGTTNQGSITFTPNNVKDVNNNVTAVGATVTLTIPNYKGDVLPSTGGMGTTLFYVLGSVLVLGALVMLITKKRMAAEN